MYFFSHCIPFFSLLILFQWTLLYQVNKPLQSVLTVLFCCNIISEFYLGEDSLDTPLIVTGPRVPPVSPVLDIFSCRIVYPNALHTWYSVYAVTWLVGIGHCTGCALETIMCVCVVSPQLIFWFLWFIRQLKLKCYLSILHHLCCRLVFGHPAFPMLIACHS